MLDHTPRCITTAFQRSDALYQRYDQARDKWLREHPTHTANEYLDALRQIMRAISSP